MRLNGLVIAAALVTVMVAGCERPAPVVVHAGQVSVVQCGPLEVGLMLPRQTYGVGEMIPAVVRVRNISPGPVVVEARSGAPVCIHLLRWNNLYEDEFKTYPQAATMVLNKWSLQPGETRNFPLMLPVEADWPRNEPIKMAAEVNGFAGACPAVKVYVVGPAGCR